MEACTFYCELLLHFSDIVSKVFQIIPIALHSVNLVGEDTEAGDFHQSAWVIQTFQCLGQHKIESGVLCEEAHIVVIHLYSFDRCCWSKMDRLIVDQLILTLSPYKVSIPIGFLIVYKGECDETGTIINLERGVSWGFSPSEPQVTRVTIF